MNKIMLVAVAWCAFVGVVPNAMAAGDAEFDKGVQLFKQENYHSALLQFVAAQREGMKEPKLDYNMGVCQYKLGLYDQARRSFMNAAKHKPMRALAHYNLGQVALAQNRKAEAQTWFKRAYDETSNEKLKTLAATRLGIVTAPATTSRNWLGGYSAEFGYDDNIQDPTLGSAANKGDNYAALLLYLSGLVQGNYSNGIRLGINGYAMRYQDVSAYDIGLLQLNLDKMFRIGEWQNVARLGLDRITLGSNDYQQATKISFSGKKPLSSRDVLKLRYRYSDITSLKNIYDKLEGTRQEALLGWQRKLKQGRVRASYEYEFNDRKDLKTATTFTSYSPTRQTVELRTDYTLSPKWEVDGRVSWRNSRYNDADLLASGSRITREDDRLLAGIKLKRSVARSLKFVLAYKYTDNNSNIAIHDYTRNLYSVGLSGAF